MKNNVFKLIGILSVIIIILALIIFICLIFQLKFEKENNSKYDDTNITNTNPTIKQDVAYELLKSKFLGKNMQVSGVVNFINDSHIFVRGNATSELDTKVETEFGILEAANIYLGDKTKFLDYTTGEKISINDIKIKDIVIVDGDVYEKNETKIMDARKGTVRRLKEADFEKMQQIINDTK